MSSYKVNLCTDCISFQEQGKKPFFSCSNEKSKFFGATFPNRLTWKICPLYKKAALMRPEGMRFIEDLRDRKEFKNSTFWIIGADPNLDFYQEPYCSNDFFKNKFSIAVNYVCYVFPESTFYIAGDRGSWERAVKEGSCNLKKSIFSVRVEKLLPSASSLGLSPSLKGQDSEPIYMRIGGASRISSKLNFEFMVRQVFSDGLCVFRSVGSSAHLAIFAAVILGARKIILVGCSHKLHMPVVKIHAHRRGLEKYAQGDSRFFDQRRRTMKKWEQYLIQLTEALKKYDVEVIRHRYDEKKKKFIFEEIVK